MPSSPTIAELLERNRSLLHAARENVFRARDLSELSRRIREENRDYREYLRELRLAMLCRYDGWLDPQIRSTSGRSRTFL